MKPVPITPDKQLFILGSTKEFWASCLHMLLYAPGITVVGCLGILHTGLLLGCYGTVGNTLNLTVRKLC